MQRQSWPTAWLMTDERLGDRLSAAIARAGEVGAGVIVRHHRSPVDVRRRIASKVLASGALLAVSRDVALARDLGAALIHNPASDDHGLPFGLSVHDEAEARDAALRRAALVFVSPLFATASHPGAPTLGEARAAALAALAACPAYALGGVTPVKGAELMRKGWAGWAGIDAWT